MDIDTKSLQAAIAAEVSRREYERLATNEHEVVLDDVRRTLSVLPRDIVRTFELLELEGFLPSKPVVGEAASDEAGAQAGAQQRARGLYLRLSQSPAGRLLNHPKVMALLKRAQQRPGGATVSNIFRVILSGVVRRIPGARRVLHTAIALRHLPERLNDLEYHIADGNTRLRNVGLQMQDQVNQGLYSHGLAIQENQTYLLKRLQRLEQSMSLQRTINISHESGVSLPASAPEMPADMYVDFEERFRGSSAQIRERLAANLRYFQPVAQALDGPVLDIGCGRGEWLQLLNEHGIQAMGVDTNPSMVEQCVKAGLQAQVGDALDFLRAQPDQSLAAISAFHVIEHVPLDVLVQLIDQARRVVRPGGVVLFETPNPENLIVGACNFYTDPTHRNPLPPALAAFMLESRGFVQVEIDRRHLADPALLLKGEDLELVQTLNRLLFGPQDYAVIGYVA